MRRLHDATAPKGLKSRNWKFTFLKLKFKEFDPKIINKNLDCLACKGFLKTNCKKCKYYFIGKHNVHKDGLKSFKTKILKIRV